MANRDVLLVRRFDRDRADPGHRRHRMVSAVTLLRTDDDATARTNWSYLLLADEIRREPVHTEWRPAMRRDGVTELACEHIARAFLHEGLFYNGEGSWSRS